MFFNSNSKIFFLFVSIICFECLFALKNLTPKEHHVECDISIEHKYDKSCSFVETTCTINDLHCIGNDTRLIFTNAKDQNFTEVIFDSSNFPALGKDIAEQFLQMQHLHISYGKLKTINDFAFQQARELRELDLSDNEIEEVRYSTFKGADDLKKLDLSSNNIKEVRYEVFETITELEKLMLHHNKLTTLDERTFSALQKLKYLNVASNELKNVHPSIIRENRQLYYLGIGGNHLNKLHLQLSSLRFNNIDIVDCSLTKLSLSHSAITTNDSIMIRELELSYNKLSNIADILLDSNIFVRKLVLWSNSLESLDETVPKFVRNVTELDLTMNPITYVSRSFFEKSVNLKKLDMMGTKLKLSVKMFEPLKQLTYLTLEKNNLKSIDVEVFDGLPKLEHLNLESNRLSDLDYKKLVKVVPSLKLINVDANHFSCDFLQEMMEYLKNNTDLRVEESMTKPWRPMTYRGIQCDTVYANGEYFWYGFMLILVVAAVTTTFLIKETLRKWFTHITYRTMANNSSSNDITRNADLDHEVTIE